MIKACWLVNWSRLGLLAALVLVAQLQAQTQIRSPSALWQQREYHYFTSATHQLMDANQALKQTVQTYCTDQTASSKAAAQASWQHSYQAWLLLQSTALGPLQDLRIDWLFSYWPDPADETGRKMRNWLKRPEQEVTLLTGGLRAMEFLLFEPIEEEAMCQLMRKISNNLMEHAKKLHHNLQALSLWNTTNTNQWQVDLIDSYRLQLISINRKWDALFNLETLKLNPLQGEAWRAQLSLDLLKYQFEVLNQHMEQGGLFNFMQAAGYPEFEEQLRQTIAAVEWPSALPQPGDPLSWTPWRANRQALGKLQKMLSNELAQRLGFIIRSGDSNDD